MAIVEAVVSFLVERLGDQLIQEVNLLREESDQVDWVKTEFKRMESFLKDMDARVEEDERVKTWRQEVRDSAYRAEDVIDTFFLEIAPLRRRHGFLGTVKRYAFFFNELMARRKLRSEIEKLKIEVESITKSRATYSIGKATSSTRQSRRNWRLSYPNIEEPDFTGFDEDVKALIQRLTQGEQRRCVVGVVGMGGLGKTTLVRKVYKSDVVKRQFHPCVWLSISQAYAVRELLQAVIRSCMVLYEDDHKKMGRMNDFELSAMISNYLAAKTYLIVLDDVWKPEAWETLSHAFPDMNNGSRVLLTTRNKDVALHADARSKPHELRFLTESESWELFCKKAFPGQNASFSQDTDELGRKIVRKCHGLPLAIIVIGGLLSRKEATEWENVYKSISWQFVEGEIQISGILALSYKDLPYDLKPCFLYLGNFPEDYEFKAQKLVKLLAAEGFLHQRGNETLEEVGEDCLKELIQRILVQVAGRNTKGAAKSCRIHDLLRDVCISQGKEEKFLEIDGGDVASASAAPPFSAFSARRLAIHHSGSLVHSTQNLRSILIYGGAHEWLDRGERKLLGRSLKLLRVLDISEVRLGNLPSEIGELIHLRYLSCSLGSSSESIRLPSSMGNLTNLQTLFFLISSENTQRDRKNETVETPKGERAVLGCGRRAAATSPPESQPLHSSRSIGWELVVQ